ncbi:MinD/ParA family ATP-binding protein [Nocardia donostiensis]|uniref:MinD/ParA family ATP-binding protein n=1 Tax=Nocardia donostiensis TaxID=1538463 RepID=UPI00158CD6C3|nr:MinD/ParA family protein [Nocardia donostiensis]
MSPSFSSAPGSSFEDVGGDSQQSEGVFAPPAYTSGQFMVPDVGSPAVGSDMGSPDAGAAQFSGVDSPFAQAGDGPSSSYSSDRFPQQNPYDNPAAGQFAPPSGEQFSQAGASYPGTGGGPYAAPSGQFSEPGGQFAPPPPGQFASQGGQFPETAAGSSPYSSGQFAQPPGQFDQPHSGNQFTQSPDGGFAPPAATGQFTQSAEGGQFTHGPGSGQRQASGQFSEPGADQFNQAGNQVSQPNAPYGSAAPSSDADQAGNPIYSWAPPPVQQPQQFQTPTPPPAAPSAPPAGPPTGQYQPPATNQQQQFQAAPQQQRLQPQQPFQPQNMPEPGQAGHSVNDLNLLKRVRKAPRSGWRRAVHKASRGMINPGESPADMVHRDLVARVNQPVRGDHRIAILSLKGGVGKTTTTVGLGSTFASVRGDRVIAIDANPDLGTLAHRVPRQTRSTVRNLLEDPHITRYSDVRAHTSQAPSRLEVLASEQDPAVSEAFSEADYRKAITILQSFYNIILTDCGTGLMHSAMAGVLDMASSLVLVTSPAIDGARSASATLDWLDHHGYDSLVKRTVVVVNASRRGSSSVDLDHLRKLFLDRTRAVQVVPFDDHLAEGAEIDLELVSKPTRRALLELAAIVAEDFEYVANQQYIRFQS